MGKATLTNSAQYKVTTFEDCRLSDLFTQILAADIVASIRVLYFHWLVLLNKL